MTRGRDTTPATTRDVLASRQKFPTLRHFLFRGIDRTPLARWVPSAMLWGMKTTASTTVETTVTKRGGKIVRAWTHTCVLECGHVETRTDAGFGGADVPPARLKCSVCGR